MLVGASETAVSLVILAGLVGFMVLVKLSFRRLGLRAPIPSQDLALSWRAIALIAGMGCAGVALSERLGVPSFLDPQVAPWQRFALPAALGLAYGAWMVVSDLPKAAPVHLEGAFSPLFYAYGAILLEVMLRLFAITALVWLVVVVLGDGAKSPAFWCAAVLAALYEPSAYMIPAARKVAGLSKGRAVLVFLVQPLFITNVLQGYLFWRFGFLATLTFRLAAYLVWHVLYGAWLRPLLNGQPLGGRAAQRFRSGTRARRSV